MSPFVPALLALLLIPQAALAHGDEDHGNAPHATLAAPVSTGPRFEAATPEVEVVAVLQDEDLVLYLDRYATNEPIANAAVEIESGPNKAIARPIAEGTYSARADWLARPGKHPVVVTIQADDVSDLVTGTLEIQSASPPPAQRTGGGF